VDAVDVAIEGPGGLRAPGESFWDVRHSSPEVRGYCLLKVQNCTGVQISDLSLRNSPLYHLVILRSRGVILERANITVSRPNNFSASNTDGVSVFASRDIILRDSHIESGDDNIVIKEDTHGIWGQNLSLERGKGIAIGSLGEWDNGRQIVTNVGFRRVSLANTTYGARIKTWSGSVGLVRNVSFEDFELRHVGVGVRINQHYCPTTQRPEGCNSSSSISRPTAGDPGPAMRIENVSYSNFRWLAGPDRAMHVECEHCFNISYNGRPVTGLASR